MKSKFIKSEKDTIITDSDKNRIFLNSFEYQIKKISLSQSDKKN